MYLVFMCSYSLSCTKNPNSDLNVESHLLTGIRGRRGEDKAGLGKSTPSFFSSGQESNTGLRRLNRNLYIYASDNKKTRVILKIDPPIDYMGFIAVN
ncbi:hypothetical protein OUZ56_011948 [Daphnia magna]|uniref:Uncharacterized protein n=1 Tax=Daphnia magna TaxID=35525 RepID=A0ABQ9Z2W9_9CRUS|nr:hypothetical protein OUZ56_011948 [Daphnia magna]